MDFKKIEDCKILGMIIGAFLSFFIIFIIPWFYGGFKIALKIYEWF